MAHSPRSGIPASGTAAVHLNQALNWANDSIPSFHGPYDYDVLLTQENKNQVGSRPGRGNRNRHDKEPARPAHTLPAGNFKHRRRLRQEVTREAPSRA